jgi:hypothetical protein
MTREEIMSTLGAEDDLEMRRMVCDIFGTHPHVRWSALDQNGAGTFTTYPDFFQDASTDYRVLSFVRLHWWDEGKPNARYQAFALHIRQQLCSRRFSTDDGHYAMYRVGDYSRAALLAWFNIPPLVEATSS